jgi:hypothetical protein
MQCRKVLFHRPISLRLALILTWREGTNNVSTSHVSQYFSLSALVRLWCELSCILRKPGITIIHTVSMTDLYPRTVFLICSLNGSYDTLSSRHFMKSFRCQNPSLIFSNWTHCISAKTAKSTTRRLDCSSSSLSYFRTTDFKFIFDLLVNVNITNIFKSLSCRSTPRSAVHRVFPLPPSSVLFFCAGVIDTSGSHANSDQSVLVSSESDSPTFH